MRSARRRGRGRWRRRGRHRLDLAVPGTELKALDHPLDLCPETDVIIPDCHAVDVKTLITLGEDQVVVDKNSLDLFAISVSARGFDSQLFAINAQRRPVGLRQPLRLSA
jgi:hypothetical protein